jgi:hypothetical protein
VPEEICSNLLPNELQSWHRSPAFRRSRRMNPSSHFPRDFTARWHAICNELGYESRNSTMAGTGFACF